MAKCIKRCLLLIWCGLSVLTTYGQENTELETDNLRELVADIAERTESEQVTEELANTIYDLAQNPIRINIATREDLEQLFWLKSYQVDQILAYIAKNGALQTIYELGYIQGFSAEDVLLLQHFVRIDNTALPDSLAFKKRRVIKQRLLFRSQRVIEKQDGFREKENYTLSNHYLGNPWKYYLKYNIRCSDKIQAGLTAEKDAGEEFFEGSNKNGFDFYSFHLQINKIKIIKTAVIGDYSLHFGQGLVVNSGYSFGKSLSVFNSSTSAASIKRYTSADENKFFRGVATTLNWRKMDLSLFYSTHKTDANVSLTDSTSNEASEVSSLQNAGVHGTPGEINDEKAIRRETSGAHLRVLFPNIEIGATAMRTSLSSSLVPEPDLYNLYYFKGNRNSNLGIDYRWRIQSLLFFGEEAISESGGIAMLNGLQYSAGSRFGMQIVHRHYGKDYQSLFSNAFGENSLNQNEDGLFAGIECNPLKAITLAAFADFFKFPWLRYQTDMPSSGREYMIQLGYKPNALFNCYIQYRNKEKEENLSGINGNKNIITIVNTQRIRCNASYKISDNWSIQNRIELSFYKKVQSSFSNGVYISQDITYTFSKLPIKLYGRYAIFDTQDYNSRLYAYENDVLYSFSVPMFYDKGSRSYVMAKVSPNRYVDVWLKYSNTQYANRTTISSNLSEIEGNRKSEVRIQVLVKF
jgi:hypothetical protein